MAEQTSINLDVTPNADGFSIAGGTTSRSLTVTGADVVLNGSEITGTGVDNQVAIWSGTSTLDGDVDFVFDGTNVGIGIASPGEVLHVVNGEMEYRYGSSAYLHERNNDSSGFGGAARHIFLKTTVSPAANDVPGVIIFRQDNDGPTSVDWTEIYAQVIDATDTSEDSQIAMTLYSAGTKQTFLRMRGDQKAAQFEIVDTTTSGPSIDLCHVKAGGNAAEDIVGNIDWIGKDTADNDTIYGNINVYAETPTTALEDGRMEFRVMDNATLTPKMAIGPNGVGIGTTSPDTQFHLFNTGAAVARIESTGTTSIPVLHLKTDSIQWGVGSSGSAVGDSTADDFWVFDYTASEYRLVIENGNGNVGLGTTSPQRQLHIAGADSGLRLSDTSATNQTTTVSFIEFYEDLTTSSVGYLGFVSLTTPDFTIVNQIPTGDIRFLTDTSNERMTIAHDGNVGIGTNAPTQILEVVDASSQIRFGSTTELEGGFLTSVSPGQALFSGGADWNGSAWTARTTTAGIIEISTSGSLNVFCDSGLTNDATFSPTKVLTALPSGRVGIGVSVPEACLHVFNSDAGVTGFVAGTDIAIESDTDSYIHMITAASNDMGLVMGHINDSADIGGAVLLKTDNALQFRAGGNTNRMTIDPTGKIGMGLINPSTNLEIGGTGTFTGAIFASDATTKATFLGFGEAHGTGVTPGYIQRYGSTHATHPNKIWHFNTADADYEFFANSSCIIKIGTDGLRTVGANKIGVGIDVPTSALHLNNDGTARVDLTIENEDKTADAQVGAIIFQALDAGDAAQTYAQISGDISSPTGGSEAGRIVLHTARASSLDAMFTVEPGLAEIEASVSGTGGTSTMRVKGGSAGSSTIAFADEGSDTAGRLLYLHGTDQLRVAIGVTSKVSINASGLAVGDNFTPTAKFQVQIAGSHPTLDADTTALFNSTGGVGSDNFTYWTAGATSGVINLNFGTNTTGDVGAIKYTHADDEMIFRTNSTDHFKFGSDGAFWITDGITAPGSTSGFAKIYVDTADGDLKIIFADGTVKTIVVDT